VAGRLPDSASTPHTARAATQPPLTPATLDSPPLTQPPQAIQLVETEYTPSGPDILISGYLPSSGGLLALERKLSFPEHKPGSLLPGAWGAKAAIAAAAAAAAPLTASSGSDDDDEAAAAGAALGRNKGNAPRVINFYKAWDEWGALGNFSPHPIVVDEGSPGGGPGGAPWPSVEHYYQAAKFTGVAHADAAALVEQIRTAPSPEEAARVGRRAERGRPELVRPDWATAKRGAMRRALRAKYTQHAGPRRMLLSTAADAAAGVPAARLVEASPNDTFWGQGFSGSGTNKLGQLLMELRDELVAEEAGGASGPGALQHAAGGGGARGARGGAGAAVL
jgi:diaminohydroxyphosphoribosylaminopyrimidine deaminase/5-amino-6-(5-phosphoribosylamino)uracil reductase